MVNRRTDQAPNGCQISVRGPWQAAMKEDYL